MIIISKNPKVPFNTIYSIWKDTQNSKKYHLFQELAVTNLNLSETHTLSSILIPGFLRNKNINLVCDICTVTICNK